jgi:hypothetical protein
MVKKISSRIINMILYKIVKDNYGIFIVEFSPKGDAIFWYDLKLIKDHITVNNIVRFKKVVDWIKDTYPELLI